ncbi:MAG: phytanoyl-CoA dioxygenase family protein [Caldilineaceae bacterium]|nr:phytanoyl-CoA dioxygenase family protein [Caldilineaceae bacterium]
METMTFQRMSPEQWQQWDEDGYLVIRNALSAEEVGELVAEVDRLDEASQRLGRDPNTQFHAVNIINAAAEDLFQAEPGSNGTILRHVPCEAFLNLIDHPSHLGIVCELIGAAIQLCWSEAMVRPPSPTPGNRWHKDGSKPYYFASVDRLTPLQWARIGFFLTDVDRPNMGNFTVVPGSHRNGFPKLPQGLEHALTVTSYTRFKQVEQIDAGVPGARQVTVRAGDAVLFHNALWHCVPPNKSQVRRKNLWYVYTPVWQRLGDRTENSPELLARCSAVRRQLLGSMVDPTTNGGIHPSDEDVPLVRLFEEKGFQQTMDAVDQEYIRATQR